MNYKQKLGYMVLGAVMTLVGVVVSVFSPSLNAHDSEYIVCKGLTVVDNKGNDAIRLTVSERRNLIVVYDKTGKRAIGLHTGETGTGLIIETRGNEIILSDKAGQEGVGTLYADEIGSSLII